VVAALSNLTNTPQFVEGTAMGIALPFLRAAASDTAVDGPAGLAGTYEYRIGSGDQVATGTLQLDLARDRLEGWLSTAPGAKVSRLSIPFLLATSNGARGAIVAPEGLLLLDISVATGKPSATITFHGGLTSSRVSASLSRLP
jgi:hypothetical protein